MYPSHAPVHDPTAVMGKRFGAYIIDVLIGGILFFIVLFSTYFFILPKPPQPAMTNEAAVRRVRPLKWRFSMNAILM